MYKNSTRREPQLITKSPFAAFFRTLFMSSQFELKMQNHESKGKGIKLSNIAFPMGMDPQENGIVESKCIHPKSVGFVQPF